MFNQIQSWPSPEIFVRGLRGGRSFQDGGSALVALIEFVNTEPQARSVAESGLAAVALVAWDNGGPFERATGDGGLAAVALVSWSQPSALVQSLPESAAAAVACVAFVNNQPAGLRTLAETVNSTVNLLSWTQ